MQRALTLVHWYVLIRVKFSENFRNFRGIDGYPVFEVSTVYRTLPDCRNPNPTRNFATVTFLKLLPNFDRNISSAVEFCSSRNCDTSRSELTVAAWFPGFWNIGTQRKYSNFITRLFFCICLHMARMGLEGSRESQYYRYSRRMRFSDFFSQRFI